MFAMLANVSIDLQAENSKWRWNSCGTLKEECLSVRTGSGKPYAGTRRCQCMTERIGIPCMVVHFVAYDLFMQLCRICAGILGLGCVSPLVGWL
jgi:hypothetical protein